jgi:MarR family 2-MHQ and catechol resistance regulon transcriptional repressor
MPVTLPLRRTPAQCHALEALVAKGPVTLNQLAAELYLDKSTASRVVATLERKGYVTKERAARDSRAAGPPRPAVHEPASFCRDHRLQE